MIDNPDKTETLLASLEANLPIWARPTQRLAAQLRRHCPGMVVPETFAVVKLFYSGDDGGILCTLDFGDPATKNVPVVSITHLTFDPTAPLAREIDAYQRHRIKKLRKLGR